MRFYSHLERAQPASVTQRTIHKVRKSEYATYTLRRIAGKTRPVDFLTMNFGPVLLR